MLRRSSRCDRGDRNALTTASLPSLAPLARRLTGFAGELGPERLLERFLDYCSEKGLVLYPAQEDALLEIFAGRHVVLHTPTGSGKSLVGLAACFQALAQGRRAFYTAPTKALVSEKFFELCGALGPENVGLMTGDASVQPGAVVLACTAEILAHMALRSGVELEAERVVMDEFHYYADRERGGAWQIPLLALPQARFVLMSATLGDTELIRQDLAERSGVPVTLIEGHERPVPLDFEYRETPLQETLSDLIGEHRFPVYVVYFTQRAASEAAQDFMSLNFLDKEHKRLIKGELAGFRFDTPFGKALGRQIHHGIGVHHAGMLPKYRRLVERLAQKGLLGAICGTDTLGVGINVPIRSVLFTALSKYDGESTALLSVRDFKQIAGRAGRRGYDERGSVIVQAPEHEIENKRLKERAAGDPKKLRRLHLKRPPERGYKPWNRETLTRLAESKPEPLTSRLSVSPSLLLSVLGRSRDACRTGIELVRASHGPSAQKRRLFRNGFAVLRSLIASHVVELGPSGIALSSELAPDFALSQELSLFAFEAIESLDRERPDFPLVLLSVIESTLESPASVLRKQVDALKTRLLAELKAQGVDYEERLAELEKVEHPKPEADFLYAAFEVFREHHRWVENSVAPKSIVRDMYERAASFNDYVKDYGLVQSEGILLRYLTDAHRALRRTVPGKWKTEEVLDIIEWLGAELSAIDASLLDEWERLDRAGRGESFLPQADVTVESPEPPDVTRNQRAFRIMVQNDIWRFVQALGKKDYARAVEILVELEEPASDGDGPSVPNWNGRQLALRLEPFFTEYGTLVTDASARSKDRLLIDEGAADSWRVEQLLTDPEGDLDWAALFRLDLPQSRSRGRPVLSLIDVRARSDVLRSSEGV